MTPAEVAIVKRPNAMVVATALKFITKVDMARSAMGVARSRPPQHSIDLNVLSVCVSSLRFIVRLRIGIHIVSVIGDSN